LPNSLKTEIVVTMNIREWRHFLKLRSSAASHPQIRQIAVMALEKYKEILPALFGDIAA
jgi:thymidylate synthase (FAD)